MCLKKAVQLNLHLELKPLHKDPRATVLCGGCLDPPSARIRQGCLRGYSGLASHGSLCLSAGLSKVSAFVVRKSSAAHSFLWMGILPVRMSQNCCDRLRAKIRRIPWLAKKPFTLHSVLSHDLSHVLTRIF